MTRRIEQLNIQAIDHIQLAMPAAQEETARTFYSGVLGIPEIPKPAALAERGGAWFEHQSIRVHLGVDPDFRAAKKAHPAFLVHDLSLLITDLHKAGINTISDNLLPGYSRIYVDDPFGNRLEFLEVCH